MTFEEFIIKKKIDLVQFKAAEPGLFSEFQSHFSQMGEKSFDHSKKFLFNKLRRTFHLKEEPKPAIVQEPVKENKLAAQAEPLLSPTIAATVYTPRFRAAGKAKPAEETEKSNADETRKPAYTPRFKAPPAKTDESPEHKTGQEISPPQAPDLLPPASAPGPKTTEPTSQPKPAYVPRFKAVPTVKEGSQQASPTPEPSEPGLPTLDSDPVEKPKPAYVPRFKPKPKD